MDNFQFPQINDKLHFLTECIDDVKDQLQKRQKNQQEILSELEQKTSEAQSSIYYLDQMGDVRNNQMSRRRIHLEAEIKLLEKEKRAQELEYWRDVSQIKKELRQLKKEYRAVKAGALWTQQN